ncbi:MAG: hypothetical protein IJ636_07830 [Bacteroidales bacterium]|nr:hypothetical protein [Bacteroidales bacterium]
MYLCGPDDVQVVPFSGTDAVVSGDSRLGSRNVTFIRSTAVDSLIANNNAHLYDLALMPRGVGRVLVYGKAKADGGTSASDINYVDDVEP